MSQDLESERKLSSPTTTTNAPAGSEELAASPTTFSRNGALPPVVTATSAAPATPTASEQAYGTGKGIEALETLLAAGKPAPAKVVALLDAHRDEHDAMLALVEAKLGAGYVTEVRGAMGLRASISGREVAAGDPGDPKGGYFVASQADQGAKWRTANGGFTGTIDKHGLDSSVAIDPHDTLHANVKTDKSATLGWNHDGVTEGELYGSYKNSNNYDAGIRRTSGGLTTSLDHQVTNGVATDAAIASYHTGSTNLTGSVGMSNGKPVESASVSAAPVAGTTVNGSVRHDATGTTAKLAGTEQLSPSWSLSETLNETIPAHGKPQTTGSLAAAYKHDTTSFNGNLTRGVDSTSIHLDGSEQPTPDWKLTEKLDTTIPDHGKQQTTINLGESYRHGNIVESGSLEAGMGTNDYLKTSGAIDAKLGNNVYGGAFGSYSHSNGHQDSAQLGASITFTPAEKQALTLAGVIDQNGAIEARLQYDVFKSKIESVGDLADHKKDALVSLFLSYRADSGNRALDDRFGAPQLDSGAGQRVMAGIKIKF